MFEPLLSYIDPMSGAIVLQVVMAAIIGGLAFFRRGIWAVVGPLFRFKRGGNNASTKA